MIDEDPAVEPDPTPDPTGTPEEIDYEAKYKSLQPEYTRATQEVSQTRQELEHWQRFEADEDYRDAYLAQLGYDVSADDDDEFADPNIARLEALEQHISAKEAAETEAQQIQMVEQYVNAQLDALDGLDTADRNWIESRALTIDATSEGMPDIKAAYEELQARDLQAQKRWAAGKNAAPRFSANGTPGNQAPDLDKMSRTDLAAYMAEQVQMADQ